MTGTRQTYFTYFHYLNSFNMGDISFKRQCPAGRFAMCLYVYVLHAWRLQSVLDRQIITPSSSLAFTRISILAFSIFEKYIIPSCCCRICYIAGGYRYISRSSKGYHIYYLLRYVTILDVNNKLITPLRSF